MGSCNIGWESLTQVKELGVLLENAPDMVGDIEKIFEQYWVLAGTNKLPTPWPAEYARDERGDGPRAERVLIHTAD